jgi:chorismate-pyruvate lyase
MVRVAHASDLQAALNRASGTVTNFLEHLVGEGIDARAHQHEMTGAPAPNGLRVEQGRPLLHRAATLHGHLSGCSYVYAESIIVTNRLPSEFCHRLQYSSEPIGRLLDQVGIAVTREDLVERERSIGSRPWNVDVTVGDCLLARAYRLDSERGPVMLVTEWFLTTLIPFLPATSGIA